MKCQSRKKCAPHRDKFLGRIWGYMKRGIGILNTPNGYKKRVSDQVSTLIRTVIGIKTLIALILWNIGSSRIKRNWRRELRGKSDRLRRGGDMDITITI